MNEKQGLLKQYNEEEIKQLLNEKVKMVYICIVLSNRLSVKMP